jgi:hypothetical protein
MTLLPVGATWLRLELRRRWRSLTVLALLIGIAATTVFAALAGARRGASAQHRLDERTLPATAMVLANVPGFDWAPVRRLPEVAALTNFVVDYTLSAVDFSPDGLGFPFADHVMFSKIEKPLIFSGRAIDPDHPDEVMVSRKFAAHTHKRVGDTLHIILATPQEVVDGGGTGPNHDTYHGPRVTLRIVGIGETSPSWGVDTAQGNGGLELSPGLYDKYKVNMLGPPGVPSNNFLNALVRLRGGESSLARFSDDFHRVTGRADIEVTDLIAQQRTEQRHVAFESRCLLAFAIAAFVAALFLIGQAIARYAAASTAELRTLRALGMTPRQAVGAASAGPVITGVVGALLGVGGAVIASDWLPFGSAGLIEPDPGIAWDWVVLGSGAIIVVLLVAAGAAAAARLAVAAERRDRPGRRSAIAAAVGQGRAPVPVVIGTRFALEAGRGRTAVPVRPALIGAVMGVLGVLAAFTFSDGVADAASHPERFGQTFQLGAYLGLNNTDFSPAGPLASALDRAPTVSGIDDARTAVATASGGHVSVSLWEYSSGPKKVPMVVLSGRAPEAVDEVALAPQTLTALRAHVGSVVTLTGDRKRAARLHVVGSALVPTGPHNGYADGGWVTRHGYDTLFRGFKFHLMLITLVPGARTPNAGPTLARALVKSNPKLKGLELDKPDPLAEVAELKEVERLPLLLGGFLALLAIGAVGHALATAVRRRSHDLAVLRALGMTQRQCRWVVITQASVLAVVGLVFGVPLGLAIGRSVWRVVADYTPIAYVPPLAVLVLLLITPGALLLANLLAAWPGRRAARMRVAQVLRTE